VIRVVLVEDQMLVRRGIGSLLELVGDIAIVADAASADEGAAVIRREKPDVVLLDVRMPGKDGIELLRELRAAQALPPTILLTTFDDDEVLFEGVKAGARGYLLKDVSLESLTAAIRSVAAGDTLIRPAITERLVRGLEKLRGKLTTPVPALDTLTKRELEILRLMAGGYSNREIADALGTVEGTVKNHASSILSKLGVRDRTRAVLKALELGSL
jgi:DNA-binding NarL/FixJ family response regulator